MLKSLDKWYHEYKTIYLKTKKFFLRIADQSDFNSRINHSFNLEHIFQFTEFTQSQFSSFEVPKWQTKKNLCPLSDTK